MEPNDKYALNSMDRAEHENYDWIVTDFINYFIFNVLGVDYFWYEWNASMMFRMLWMGFRNPSGCPPVPRPQALPNKQTFYWPYIDSDREECQRVRLYNLNEDPTESNNLAFDDDHKDIVEYLMRRLKDKLSREYELGQIEDDVGSEGLLPLIEETTANLQITILIIMSMLLLLILDCCFKCFKRSKGFKTKTE